MSEDKSLAAKLKKEENAWRQMMELPACRRFLKRLLETSGCLRFSAYEAGGKDGYNRGREDLIKVEVVARVVKFFGWGGIDSILRKEDDDG